MNLSDKQAALLDEHLSMVLEANNTLNLTRIESIDQAHILHIEDSLSALEEVNAAPHGALVDIGSGAGYPGIPLAVATGRRTVLLEARKNKAAFLADAIHRLGLQNTVTACHARAEEYASEHLLSFTVVTARAVAQLSILMELASPFLKKGGRLVCYKGEPKQEEMNHALSLEKATGLKLISNRSLCLGEEATMRHIVCFEKVSKPGIQLPRHVGFAQKKPL